MGDSPDPVTEQPIQEQHYRCTDEAKLLGNGRKDEVRLLLRNKAQLDAIGIFGYSDEDKTEALDLSDKVDAEIIAERVQSLSALADEMVTLRAATRIGEQVRVLIEDEENQEGRAAHQGPEVDGTTSFVGTSFKVGQYVDGVITQSLGADLIARPL